MSYSGAMFTFLAQKIKIKNLKLATFVFVSLFAFSFAVFSLADTQNTSSKNIFQDTDQDGLSNEEERLYGTDSHKADTDGDGYSDGTEIKSGYNPLKAAPGDKVSTITDTQNADVLATTTSLTKEAQKTNLTEEVSRQVVTVLKESTSNKQDISLDDLRSVVQEIINTNVSTDTLPEIDEKSIKIQKQKYSNLSELDRTAKIKEDTLAYVTAVSYILVNTSPVPMQSDDDMQKLASFVTANSMGVLSGENAALLDDFTVKGNLIAEQLQDLEVPENMLPMHMKTLRLAQYITTFKEKIKPKDSNDPLAQINTFAQITGCIQLLADLATDIEKTLAENGIADVSNSLSDVYSDEK